MVVLLHHHTRRHVLGDDATSTYQAIVANGHSFQYNHIRSNPTILPDVYRSRVECLTDSFFGRKLMIVVEYFDSWTKDASAANAYGILATYHAIAVHVYMVAYLQYSLTVCFNATSISQFTVFSYHHGGVIENLECASCADSLDRMPLELVSMKHFYPSPSQEVV